MQRFRDFLKRKDIEISLRRYGIDALGAMAQGLFCSLLIGTILNTLGQQFHIGFLNAIIFTLGKGDAAGKVGPVALKLEAAYVEFRDALVAASKNA